MNNPSAQRPTTADLLATTDAFTDAYLEAALWSSTDNADDSGGAPLDDNYGPEDIEASALESAIEDCRDFQKENAHDLEGIDPSQAGHDFWLTRNGHGTGFWDRPEVYGEQRAKHLTAMAKGYGELCLNVGDDGTIDGF